MRRLISMIFGMLVGGGIVYAGFYYHLVRTSEKWLIVPRKNVAFEDPYVDMRTWKPDDWAKHQQFAKDMIAAGHGELVVQATTKNLFQEVVEQAADHLDRD
ncbi:MAG: hypothetical protein O2955_05470 [Planctomycetota bacterium]|nr:hypothetical protein [Planctomycetota bacterium]MDA1211941.1 hypothetical protein [Planctomycetota bacterium]